MKHRTQPFMSGALSPGVTFFHFSTALWGRYYHSSSTSSSPLTQAYRLARDPRAREGQGQDLNLELLTSVHEVQAHAFDQRLCCGNW